MPALLDGAGRAATTSRAASDRPRVGPASRIDDKASSVTDSRPAALGPIVCARVLDGVQRGSAAAPLSPAIPLARPVRLERTTRGLEGRCSIQLSYGRKRIRTTNYRTKPLPSMASTDRGAVLGRVASPAPSPSPSSVRGARPGRLRGHRRRARHFLAFSLAFSSPSSTRPAGPGRESERLWRTRPGVRRDHCKPSLARASSKARANVCSSP